MNPGGENSSEMELDTEVNMGSHCCRRYGLTSTGWSAHFSITARASIRAWTAVVSM